MILLVINCGSSTLKYRLFDMAAEWRVLCRGMVDRLGQEDSVLHHVSAGRTHTVTRPFADSGAALDAVLALLSDPDRTELNSLKQIVAVGYRVVHGGDRFQQITLIDDQVLSHITALSEFAPLHNPVSALAIDTARHALPWAAHVAVFDTAANQSMPPKAYLYALPAALREKFHIRKYGFHGISQDYVAHQAARVLAKDIKELRMISCHLGNGISITAFDQGRIVDTSMGLTPLEGVVMATRSGDVDPGAVLQVMEAESWDIARMRDCLNQESGLLGLCGQRDMREILHLAGENDHKAQTALEVFVYRIQKYIGAYAAALNGVDVIIFTAGIGENSAEIRRRILKHTTFLGVVLDERANAANETMVSTPESRVKVLVIETNEERAIAEQMAAFLSDNNHLHARRFNSIGA